MSDEAVDIYSDQFQVTTGPFGAMLNFGLTGSTPPPAGSLPPVERKATVRMSLEHMKVMTFLLHRQVMQHETQTGVKIPIPQVVLNALQIGLEDWNHLWKG